MQDTTTLAQQVSVVAPAAVRNVNLNTDPKRTAIHNMPHIVAVIDACKKTDTLFTIDWYDGKKMVRPQSDQLYIEMLTQTVEGGHMFGEIQRFRKEMRADNRRLAQFSLGQTDIRDCVPFLINRENVI